MNDAGRRQRFPRREREGGNRSRTAGSRESIGEVPRIERGSRAARPAAPAWRTPKAYLRGLTQREESREGADFFAQLSASKRIYAFQFKVPKGPVDGEPYRFAIQRRQHEKLSRAGARPAGGVYYVLPFYVSPAKLEGDVPHLLRDTWILRVSSMRATDVFGPHESRTIRCRRGLASVNPDYALQRGSEMEPDPGIPVRRFSDQYAGLRDGDLEIVGRRPRGACGSCAGRGWRWCDTRTGSGTDRDPGYL